MTDSRRDTPKVYVATPRPCDVHLARGLDVEATVDGRTVGGQWANLCDSCHERIGVGLGVGRGQLLIVGEPPERTRAQIRAELYAAIEAGDFEAAFDACGDEDPTLYL